MFKGKKINNKIALKKYIEKDLEDIVLEELELYPEENFNNVPVLLTITCNIIQIQIKNDGIFYYIIN
jgi:hypothetical protein